MTFLSGPVPGPGTRVAVKDLLDWRGLPTTAGCRAVAATAAAATADATCLEGLRALVTAGAATMVGKVGLHELAFGTTGVNPWFGTPVNPLAADRVPGGSSSGSAVAVADGHADWAVGTDTAGSVRIPAACCGVAGFIPSAGRVPLDGVWPLAPSFDRVGPLARSLAGVCAGAAVLCGLVPSPPGEATIGRLRPSLPTDPAIDVAVDAALASFGARVVEVDVPGWADVVAPALAVLGSEAWERHGSLVRAAAWGVGDDVARGFAHAATIGRQRVRDARSACARFASSLPAAFGSVSALALPTLGLGAPTLASGASPEVGFTLPVNVAGLPAVTLPLGPPGVSLQLVGPPGGDAALLGLALAVEAAL